MKVHMGEIIDLNRYPIADGSTPAFRDLVEALRADLAADQYCVLPDFIHEVVRKNLVREIEGLQERAYPNRSRRNCYLQQDKDPTLPGGHPRNIFFEASYRMIANDLFADSSPLKRIYHWQPMIDFVAQVVGIDRLYVSEDPNTDRLGAVLQGDRSRVVTVPRKHRALVIFRGARSLHRVTPVSGEATRLMAVFVYEKEPGILGDLEVNATVYGPRTRLAR